MREFASAGGELVIHAALHPKKPATAHSFIKSRCEMPLFWLGLQTGSKASEDSLLFC
jgi:hypothetical protein